MTALPFDYLLFGLRLRSDIELPELPPTEPAGQPDVRVRVTSIEVDDQASGLSAHDGGLLLRIDKVARFLVRDGMEILVEPVEQVDPRNVRLFLLGSAFGALLHQRGLLPLHANAIEIDGAAFAFMGESGAGKSTLAAWFHDHGHRILADDVCVVHFDDEGRPSVFPGLPRLRLWLDAIERSGRASEGLTRSYVDANAAADKFDVPVQQRPAAHEEVQLKALFVLDRAEAFALEPLAGVAAAEAIFAHTYRGSLIADTGDPQTHWSSVLKLAAKTPIYRVARRWDYGHFEEDFGTILKEVERIIAS